MNDLLKDETFLARWLAGELSEVEQSRFQQHPDFGFYQQMLGTTDGMTVEAVNQDSLFEKIQEEKINKRIVEPKKPAIRRRLFFYSTVAAVAALFVGYFVFLRPDIKEIRTLAEQQIMHLLPDGSSVLLSPNSEMVYAANTFKNNRQLQLNGQAFFEVKKGDGFLIETKQGKVEVLGTSFSVFSKDQSFIVACKSGRVRVSDNDGQEEVLTQGERVRTKSSKLQEKESIVPAVIGNWQDSISRFQSEKLYIVVQAIENQFGVQVNIPESMTEEKFTGSFLHKDLSTALRMVFDPMNMEYEEIEKNVFEVRVDD